VRKYRNQSLAHVQKQIFPRMEHMQQNIRKDKQEHAHMHMQQQNTGKQQEQDYMQQRMM